MAYVMPSKFSLASSRSRMSAVIGWVDGSWSARYAQDLRLLAKVIQPFLKRVDSTIVKAPMKSANDSFSHRSSHHCMVTRSPNHMWAISCRMTLARLSYAACVTLPRKMYSSRNVTQPGFSIAPRLYSGTNAWSYFPNGYG